MFGAGVNARKPALSCWNVGADPTDTALPFTVSVPTAGRDAIADATANVFGGVSFGIGEAEVAAVKT